MNGAIDSEKGYLLDTPPVPIIDSNNAKSFQEQIRDSNSMPGINEFDEFPFFGKAPSANTDSIEMVPLQTAGNRQYLYRTRFGPQRNFRRGK